MPMSRMFRCRPCIRLTLKVAIALQPKPANHEPANARHNASKIAPTPLVVGGGGELQRELANRAPVAVDEVADMLGHGDSFDVASGLDFGSNGLRNVIRPMLKCVEGDNADWIIKLASQKIGDDGFEIRPFDLCFAAGAATRADAVHNEVSGLIGPVGHELR